MPELRKDPILGRWVIIATERGVRPKDYTVTRTQPTEAFCPFCPGNESATPGAVLSVNAEGVSTSEDWAVRVVPNKFPALKIEGDLDKRGHGLYDMMNGIGAHEVSIETSHHDKSLADLSQEEIENVLRAWRDRLLDLKKDARFRYGVVFKNHGAVAGASLEHSHSQLIALPIVPKRVSEEMMGALSYYEFRNRCVYCDIVEQETRSGERVIFETEHVLAIAPFASRSPFETWLIPRAHAPSFEAGSKVIFEEMAQALKTVLCKLKKALDNPPYNFMLHTSPFGDEGLPHYHWHVEILPALTNVAGFEWGSGFYINPTPPERAAQFLRAAEVTA